MAECSSRGKTMSRNMAVEEYARIRPSRFISSDAEGRDRTRLSGVVNIGVDDAALMVGVVVVDAAAVDGCLSLFFPLVLTASQW